MQHTERIAEATWRTLEDEGVSDEILPLFQGSQTNGTGALRTLPPKRRPPVAFDRLDQPPSLTQDTRFVGANGTLSGRAL